MVAALRLAQSGDRVALFEAREQLGGICASEEFGPGFFTDGLSHQLESWSSTVSQQLGLSLELTSPAPRYIPETGGPGLSLHYDPEQATAELGKRGYDSSRYKEYRAFIDGLRPLVKGIASAPAPSLSSEASIFDYVLHALRFRRLGADTMMEVLRIGAMSAEDWVSEFSDDPLVRAALAAPACFSGRLGPRSPTGTANLLYEECLRGDAVVGGARAIMAALEAALERSPVEVHTSAAVTAIRVTDGAVCGLGLADGQEVDAERMVAACSPQRALLELVDPRHLPITVTDQVLNLRSRGAVAVAHFAIEGLLEFAQRSGERIERALIGENTLEWEKCFDHVKHRRLAPLPCLDIRLSAKADPSRCPEGHEILNIQAFGAPYDLDGGWGDEARGALESNIIASLERYAPAVSKQIVASRVLTPVDLEREYGLPGGHLFHGEHAIDQLWMTRPTPTLAQHQTPIRGLFLGSSGSHPGGGVHGLCGLLAAEALLGS
jgi:phytoene dehydrogenase-like protein